MSAVESSEFVVHYDLLLAHCTEKTISVKKWVMVTFHFQATSRYTIQCSFVISSISMTAPLI